MSDETTPSADETPALKAAIPFGPQLGVFSQPRPLDYIETKLLGVPESISDQPILAPHEVAVIRWLRRELVRVSDPDAASNVGVLLVGELHHCGVVDHQLDHVGAGITSVMHGEEIAHGYYSPAGMFDGDTYNRHWSISVNMLQDQTGVHGFDDPAIEVTMPELGEVAREAFEREEGGIGTLAKAREILAAFPGHEFRLFSAWYNHTTSVRTVEEAEAFFAENGEWSEAQEAAIDATDFLPAEAAELLAQRKGIDPQEALMAVLREAAGEKPATEDTAE